MVPYQSQNLPLALQKNNIELGRHLKKITKGKECSKDHYLQRNSSI